MPESYGKDMRKVLQVGESTGITLPREYLDESGIKRGDSVEVVFFGSVLKIKPISSDKLQREIGRVTSAE